MATFAELLGILIVSALVAAATIVGSAVALVFGLGLAVSVLIYVLCRGRDARAIAYQLTRLSRDWPTSDSETSGQPVSRIFGLFISALFRILAFLPALAMIRLLVMVIGSVRLSSPRGRSDVRRIAPSAAGLLAVAARLLPAADADRYAEEYLSDLWELAESGGDRPRQLRYAVRQLVRAFPLRFVLRSPRRRSARL